MDASSVVDGVCASGNMPTHEVQTKEKSALKDSRSAYKGHLTRIYQDIEPLLRRRRNVNLIEEKLRALELAFTKFEQAHIMYIDAIDDSKELQVAISGFDSELQRKHEFCERVNKWLNSVRNEETCSDVLSSDSVSQHGLSLTSNKSHHSGSSMDSRLSVKIKVAKAERAIAKLKFNQLKKKIELQQKRDAVQREQEILEAENEVERATLRAHILEEEDGVEQIVDPSQAPEDKSLFEPERAYESVYLIADAKEEKMSAPLPGPSVTLNPAAPVWSRVPNRCEAPSTRSCNEVSPPEARFQQLLQQQQEMIQLQQQTFQSVASTIRQGFALPKPELSKFDGNPLEFWNFIRSFESNIEKNASDESAKLSFLLQYCTGAARNAIKSCVSMDPAFGYQTARALLQDRFGHPFKIAVAHLNQITHGPPVKPYDQKGLLAFADQLRDCQNALESIGYLDEINSADNLRRIVDRLPFHLKTKWLEIADSIQQTGQRPRIHHISQFVTTKARVANNPVFGGALTNDKEKGNPRNKSSNPGAKMTTYATQGGFRAPVSPSAQVEGVKVDRRLSYKFGINASLKRCLVCHGMHQLWNCEQFKNKSYSDRIRIVRDARLCENCFKIGHMAKGCMQRSGCYVEGCGKKHMTVLHPPVQPLPVGHGTQDSRRADQELGHSESSTSGVVTELSSQSQVIGAGVNGQNGTGHIADKVRLRIVPVRVRGNQPGKVVETYALLDNGSDVTLCDRKLVDELGITGQPRSFMLTTQESKNSERSGLEVKLIVGSINGDSSLEVPRAWTVDRLNISECSIPRDHDVTKWPHLNGIELPEIDSKEVRVLIGCNVPEAFWVLEERRGGRGEPVAIRSLLGWTLIGPTVKVNEESSFCVNFVRLNDESDSRDETLLLQVKNFWETDFADSISSSKVAMSVEDERALAIMESSVRRVSRRYQVALPWRRQPPYLPNNRVAVEQRLSLLKKRFHRDPEFFARYKAAVNDYIAKGYAKQVPVEELYPNGRPLWYLPHHAVFHPHKPDKLRVVFDCAARFKGTSLNDQLLHGPDLTNSLFGVLQRFRQEPVALVSDIEAMFHQVKVDPLDSDALRFLWWPNDDLSAQPFEYRMEVHLFGSTSSPSCANFCIRKTAQDNIGNFSHQVIDTVLKNFYVDDCLKSVQSSYAAIDLRSQLCELLQKGGFRLTKWSCNSKDVLETIPNADRAPSSFDLDLKAEELPIERTLGVQWSMETDMFIFKLLPKDKPYTRRGILSVTSSIYDPLGIISPVVLSAKKLIQDLCKQGLSWDEEIKEEEAIRWKKWLSELPKLSQISLARCLKPADFGVADVTELHHFADASQIAYGAVSYARFVNEERNAVHCSFLVGKSRLAHVKPMTIPRLELSAAVVAVKLDRTLREELEIKIDRSVFWSDSTAVLQYIKNEDKRFHTFVANRLAVIHDGSKPSQWNFVESARNPADDASRGLTPEELLLQDRWFKGPVFLWKLEESWPVPSSPLPSIPDQDPEIKSQGQTNRTTMVSEESNLNSMIQRYSSWYELKRGVAWLLRFREYIRRKCYPPNDALPQGELSLEELRFTELHIVKYVQRLSFPEIFSALQASNSKTQEKRALRTSGSSGSIYKLRPMLDKEGALRVGGRLMNASLNYQSKHQLLLPYNHHLSRLLIMAHHQSVGHLGQEYVLTSLRKKYWIIKGRAAVRKVLSGCLTCRKQNSLRGQQMMADLPKERLTPGDPPFSYVGIDYFGPLFVKRGRSIVKHYGCLFSCLTLRATHIEVAESLETDSFISALRRFISQRGKPRVIISDNGTNLCGGERELREAVDSWNQQKINSFLHQRNIDWKFNPPGASHMGGVWERVIRSVRKVLRVLLREQLVSGEALRTLMAEVESILNGRPLTRNSDDPADMEPLTPNHLLLMQSNLNVPPGVFVKGDLYCRNRWKQVQYLADVFWKRWLSEYLPSFQERQKWLRPRRNFVVGDLVLIADERVHRGQWPLGRVVEVHPGSDGLTRSVKVATRTTVLSRPVTKLCFLEQEHLS